MKNNRISFVSGAGITLDFDFPDGSTFPSTGVITEEVCKPYRNVLTNEYTHVVKEIFDHLKHNLPPDINPWANQQEPYVHFEMLFHILEQYRSYMHGWSGKCHNAEIYPYFAPFTGAARVYNIQDIDVVFEEFILRIMRIVNQYDEYFRNDRGKEDWYRDFFWKLPWKWDVFNFNYDTTIEQSLGAYEDGFMPVDGDNYYEFIPQKLWNNAKDLSTINHIHGCILYYHDKNTNRKLSDYDIHDIFKYDSFKEVESMMMGRSQSNPVSQTHEEYYCGPIITGMRKTEKLNCIPYDFYHGNLFNCLVKNRGLIIAGYSFGDFYCNNLLERMNILHGDKKRIVIIDKWNVKKLEEVRTEHYVEYEVPSKMNEFLMRMTGTSDIYKMIKAFNLKQDISQPLYSDNGQVMLMLNGFHDSTVHMSEIESFINS